MTEPDPAEASPILATRWDGTAGPWLVLIHGWSCNGTLWDELVPHLTSGFRVVTLDLPGHGLSETREPLTVMDMAKAVATTLRRRNIADPILVGHSMGGPVALETTILLGQRCRLVIGVDTFSDAAFYARRPAAEIAERIASLLSR